VKVPLTADSLRLAASAGCSGRNIPKPSAVSRKPTALPDVPVCELYGLTEADLRPIIPTIGEQLAE
jgi:hypothetical protein